MKIIKRKLKTALPKLRAAFTLLSKFVKSDHENWHLVVNAEGQLESALEGLNWLETYIDELEVED